MLFKVEDLLIVAARILNGYDQRTILLAISHIVVALNSVGIELSSALGIFLKAISLNGNSVLMWSRNYQVIKSDDCFIIWEHWVIAEAFEFNSGICFDLGHKLWNLIHRVLVGDADLRT